MIGIPAQNVTDDRFKATIPLQRAGTVEEAAGSVLMLCSPMASYITGQCIEVTGGIHM
jgi:3-oxoacyl-[acyl-carrier protein] reductase